ncbi:HypC/HybG/HupF family hydrogenase formation chaperone [Devriesea agamarum]|uniref:HypC/HybG/HupF family hydrogenase formation chaperone n=1 Tax=Devriesea agamarum TaxID=472569 RepID=UPI00071E242E|nr:HypC/HybG/HupF family hydrogenase formation chaperone [Devriesea agamarum]
MCFAIPGRVLSVADDATGNRRALVDIVGEQREASLAWIPDIEVGEWVIIHAGYAMTRVPPEQAESIIADMQNLHLLASEHDEGLKPTIAGRGLSNSTGRGLSVGEARAPIDADLANPHRAGEAECGAADDDLPDQPAALENGLRAVTLLLRAPSARRALTCGPGTAALVAHGWVQLGGSVCRDLVPVNDDKQPDVPTGRDVLTGGEAGGDGDGMKRDDDMLSAGNLPRTDTPTGLHLPRWWRDAAAHLAPGDIVFLVGAWQGRDELLRRIPLRRAHTVWIGSRCDAPPPDLADARLILDSSPATLTFDEGLDRIAAELSDAVADLHGALTQTPQITDDDQPSHGVDYCVTCSDEGRIGEILSCPSEPGDFARVLTECGIEDIDTTLIGAPPPGTLILIHAQQALQTITES